MTALAWQWAKGVSSPIIGGTKAAYLEDLAAAKELEEFGPSLHIETIHRPRWAK